MKEENNFKKVYEKEAPKELRESSLKNTQESVNTVRSFFDVLDLYISKFFGAIIHSFKDNSNNNNSISARGSIPFSLNFNEENDKKENQEDSEDWYSDSDAPKDI